MTHQGPSHKSYFWSVAGTIFDMSYWNSGMWLAEIHVRLASFVNSRTLLEYDVTRRDPLSVVMDAGSRIVHFIRDGQPSDDPEIYIQHWCACAVVPREPASMTTERKWWTPSDSALKLTYTFFLWVTVTPSSSLFNICTWSLKRRCVNTMHLWHILHSGFFPPSFIQTRKICFTQETAFKSPLSETKQTDKQQQSKKQNGWRLLKRSWSKCNMVA